MRNANTCSVFSDNRITSRVFFRINGRNNGPTHLHLIRSTDIYLFTIFGLVEKIFSWNFLNFFFLWIYKDSKTESDFAIWLLIFCHKTFLTSFFYKAMKIRTESEFDFKIMICRDIVIHTHTHTHTHARTHACTHARTHAQGAPF